MPMIDLKFSPILFSLERLFRLAERISPERLLVKPRIEVIYSDTVSRDLVARRARQIDRYILIWLIIELVLTSTILQLQWRSLVIMAVAIGALRIFDILQTAINLTIFDALRRGVQKQNVASLHRTLVLSIINYSELMLLFGMIYASE